VAAHEEKQAAHKATIVDFANTIKAIFRSRTVLAR